MTRNKKINRKLLGIKKNEAIIEVKKPKEFLSCWY